MNDLYANILILLSVGILALVLIQGLYRKIELFSMRNLYLVGLIGFQLKSAIDPIRLSEYAPYKVYDLKGTAQTFVLYALSFTVLFLLSYHKLPLASFFSRRFRTKRAYEVRDQSLLLLAVALAILGAILKIFGAAVPGANLLFSIAAGPSSAVACGLVGWVWGNRRFNMFVVSVGAAVFLLAMYSSLTNAFGRRGLMSICLALAWGAYFRMGIRLKPKTLIAWLVPLGLVAMFFVGAFTNVRQAVREGADVQAIMRMIFLSSARDSFGAVASHSGDGRVALWAIDAFPERHEQRPLFSLQYMAYHPIPRVLWPDKPVPLSKLVAAQANIQGVNQSLVTIPPGVLGYAAAEGGWYALVIYALFFGQFCRFFDQIVTCNPTNPFLVLPVGCALGEAAGLARGDIAIFGNTIILGFLATWFIMAIAQKLIARPLHLSAVPAGAPQ